MPVNVEPTLEHPVPDMAYPQEPSSHSDKLRSKANTALLLKELGGEVTPTEEEKKLALEMMQNVDGTPPDRETQKKQAELIENNPGIALALSGYISHYDKQVIADKVQLRNIAVNRLLEMSQADDQKIAIKAIELIGKASDLFTDHQQITITHKNSAELQEAIREKIRLLMQMNTIDITPKSEKIANELKNDATDAD